MSDLVPVGANLPAHLQDAFNVDELAGDLYDGASSGFAVVSIKGSRWKIKHGGEEMPVLDDNDEPKPSIEVVIVKASRDISKLYYAKAYAEGDDSPPDCFSAKGDVPDPESVNPQADTCATCAHNVWGSKITDAGKKTKACGDSRRIAVVPLDDINNELHGGAMLLRVPAASLSDLAKYGKGMAAKGFPYNAVGTRLGFDIDAAYPKLTFKPIRALTDEQLADVAEAFHSDTVSNILSQPAELRPVAPQAATVPKEKPKPKKAESVSLDFDEPAAEKPVAKKAAAKKPAARKPAAKKEPEVPANANGAADINDDLDDLLSDLDSLA